MSSILSLKRPLYSRIEKKITLIVREHERKKKDQSWYIAVVQEREIMVV